MTEGIGIFHFLSTLRTWFTTGTPSVLSRVKKATLNYSFLQGSVHEHVWNFIDFFLAFIYYSINSDDHLLMWENYIKCSNIEDAFLQWTPTDPDAYFMQTFLGVRVCVLIVHVCYLIRETGLE